jgi:hypothetical protein
MVLREELEGFKEYVFEPIFVNINWPEITVLVEQILKSGILLSSQCNLKNK